MPIFRYSLKLRGADDDGEWSGDAMDWKDSERARDFPHLGAAFRTNVEQFGPNDFFVMQKCMKEVTECIQVLCAFAGFDSSMVMFS